MLILGVGVICCCGVSGVGYGDEDGRGCKVTREGIYFLIRKVSVFEFKSLKVGGERGGVVHCVLYFTGCGLYVSFKRKLLFIIG